MGQTWEDLLFAHWRVPVERCASTCRRSSRSSEHDGSAWLGVTPFRLTGLRARGMLPLPRVSSFLELNVRTYVRGRTAGPASGSSASTPRAGSRSRLRGARTSCRTSTRACRPRGAASGSTTSARGSASRAASFSGRYRPAGARLPRRAGLARVVPHRAVLPLHDRRARALHRAEIHHELWPLQPAEAEIELASISPIELRASRSAISRAARTS